jgi:hypothetical protein
MLRPPGKIFGYLDEGASRERGLLILVDFVGKMDVRIRNGE